MADFDRHRVDFTEGPLVFRLDADALSVPSEFVAMDPGACHLAELSCEDPMCAGESVRCGEDGVCILEPTTILMREVEMGYAYEQDLLRVESVLLEDLSVALTATDLNTRVERGRILWAPALATAHEATELVVIGPFVPGQSPGWLEIQTSSRGRAALEDHLRTYPGFRLFVEFQTELVPGAPCPDGDLEIEVSMRFLLTGEAGA
jgi:hypothetical protein